MGYHKSRIEKGKLGEASKITEEYLEWLDGNSQKDIILELCELSDLLGAIKHYVKNWNMSLEDLINFNNKTEKAFKDGTR